MRASVKRANRSESAKIKLNIFVARYTQCVYHIGMTNTGKAVAKRERHPLFACQECGKNFYTVASAERASFGDHGCPKCGGSDIDVYVPEIESEVAA